MKKYALEAPGIDHPINVEISIPSSWKENLSKPGSPKFTIPGQDSMMSLVAIRVDGDDGTAAVNKAIALQYGDGSGAQREDLPGGRVWVVRRENDYQHARVFAPFPGGVAMAFAMNEDPDAKGLPEVKAAFSTFKVVP